MLPSCFVSPNIRKQIAAMEYNAFPLWAGSTLLLGSAVESALLHRLKLEDIRNSPSDCMSNYLVS